MSTAKRGLGRGLNALFEDEETPAFAAPPVAAIPEDPTAPRKTLPVGVLRPGKFQPRQSFDDSTLKDLSESIATHGILQPILVRPLKSPEGQFEIICGERRWRAAQKAQLHNVPVIVR
ncbi:MAG TPA: ParB/RepB/Spo0J family partition protein, partial [Micavibrio sp.]